MKSPLHSDGKSVAAALGAMREAADIAAREARRTLTRLGEETVAYARDRAAADSWVDRTGNLRSSVGYGVYDGRAKAVDSGFPQVKDGAEGPAEGRKYLEGVAAGLAAGARQSLVVVAGMDYASDVEALDNKDVLAGPELMARRKLPGYMERTRRRVEELVNRLLK